MPSCFLGPASTGTGNAKILRVKVFLTSSELGRMTNLLAPWSVLLVWKRIQGWDGIFNTHPKGLLLTIVK